MEINNQMNRAASDLMPNDEASQKILRERADQLAYYAPEIKKKSTVHYIRFKMGDNEYYGIPYENVYEVIDHVVLTKIPHVHECVAGVINYRGILLTIIDLIQLFQIKSSESLQKIYVIVTKVDDISIGIMANDIVGIDEYEKEKINNEIIYQGCISTKHVLGIHNGMTTLLNMNSIMNELKKILAKR